MGPPSLISIVIPTLNEAAVIGGTLQSAKELPGAWEIIVADGGSHDGTRDIAERAGVRVVTAAPGRGSQMQAGALLARGGVIVFLHADSRLPGDAYTQIVRALTRPEIAGGNFRIRFDGGSRPARFLTWLYPHLRRLGLLYGDSAIFVRSSSYREAGGMRPYPIFEDLDLVFRLRGRGRLTHLDAEVLTSSRRFQGRPFLPTFLRWAALQVLFWCGVSPYRLAGAYPHIRGPRRDEVVP